jgi:hypothetical protein
LIKDDNCVDTLQFVVANEDDRMHQKLSHNIEPKVHLNPVQLTNELIREEDRVEPDQSQNKVGQKQLWDLLEEFQGVFTWHKGELGYCFVGKHSIDTQGLPPC